jgi:hypothetical protein
MRFRLELRRFHPRIGARMREAEAKQQEGRVFFF